MERPKLDPEMNPNTSIRGLGWFLFLAMGLVGVFLLATVAMLVCLLII